MEKTTENIRNAYRTLAKMVGSEEEMKALDVLLSYALISHPKYNGINTEDYRETLEADKKAIKEDIPYLSDYTRRYIKEQDFGMLKKMLDGKKLNDALEMSKFDEVLKDMSDLHRKKNTDYGNAFERNLDNFGVTYGIGRLYEKVERAVQVSKNGALVDDERLADTIFDLGVYAVMITSYLKDNGSKGV